MKKSVLGIVIGAIVGGAAGLFGLTALAGSIWGNGQAVFAGICWGIPVGAPLGALVGWLIGRRFDKR